MNSYCKVPTSSCGKKSRIWHAITTKLKLGGTYCSCSSSWRYCAFDDKVTSHGLLLEWDEKSVTQQRVWRVCVILYGLMYPLSLNMPKKVAWVFTSTHSPFSLSHSTITFYPLYDTHFRSFSPSCFESNVLHRSCEFGHTKYSAFFSHISFLKRRGCATWRSSDGTFRIRTYW